jgi:hypothetical protein
MCAEIKQYIKSKFKKLLIESKDFGIFLKFIDISEDKNSSINVLN